MVPFPCHCCGQPLILSACPFCGQQQPGDVTEQAVREAEWLACEDGSILWQHIKQQVSERKARLFAFACLRRLDHLLDEEHRRVLRLYEQFADGLMSKDIFLQETESFRAGFDIARGRIWRESRSRAEEAEDAVRWLGQGPFGDEWNVLLSGQLVADWVGRWALNAEKKTQSNLVRDLVGNPYCPSPIRDEWRAWNGGTLVRMAQNIYDERAFAELPILADALEEAGCGDEQILSHCREPGEHVRGCWVVDGLLGRT